MKLDIEDIIKAIVEGEITNSNLLLEDQEEIKEFLIGNRDRVNMYNLNKELERVLDDDKIFLENKIKAIENYLFIMKEIQDYVDTAIKMVNDSYEKLKAAKAKQDEHKRKQEEKDNTVYNIFLDHTNKHVVLDKNYVNYEHRKKIGCKLSKIYSSRSYSESYCCHIDMEFPPEWSKLVLTDYEPVKE